MTNFRVCTRFVVTYLVCFCAVTANAYSQEAITKPSWSAFKIGIGVGLHEDSRRIDVRFPIELKSAVSLMDLDLIHPSYVQWPQQLGAHLVSSNDEKRFCIDDVTNDTIAKRKCGMSEFVWTIGWSLLYPAQFDAGIVAVGFKLLVDFGDEAYPLGIAKYLPYHASDGPIKWSILAELGVKRFGLSYERYVGLSQSGPPK